MPRVDVMAHEWRKKSALHHRLWRMGLSEKEADVISECQNRPLGIAVAEWAMRERAREVLEIAGKHKGGPSYEN